MRIIPSNYFTDRVISHIQKSLRLVPNDGATDQTSSTDRTAAWQRCNLLLDTTRRHAHHTPSEWAAL